MSNGLGDFYLRRATNSEIDLATSLKKNR